MRRDIEAAQASNPGSRALKQVEKKFIACGERLKEKLERPRDPGLSFDETGIDYLVIDELHDYKNLATASAIRDAAIAGSGRAQDLHMKVEYLRETYGDRVMTGATATPLANSMTEMYVMTRYLAPHMLHDAGIDSFDQWAATFGEVTTSLELLWPAGPRSNPAPGSPSSSTCPSC